VFLSKPVFDSPWPYVRVMVAQHLALLSPSIQKASQWLLHIKGEVLWPHLLSYVGCVQCLWRCYMCYSPSFCFLGHHGESTGKYCLAPPLSLNPEGCALEVLPSHPGWYVHLAHEMGGVVVLPPIMVHLEVQCVLPPASFCFQKGICCRDKAPKNNTLSSTLP